MGTQSEAFQASEGEAWLRRNVTKLPVPNDPVLEVLTDINLKPQSVLEVGCADGWRLEILRGAFDCKVAGIEPAGPGPSYVKTGTAANLSDFKAGQFDLVIYGFCLYLCDREDLFKIVAEGDRVLADNGFLVVYDFHAEVPHSVKYHHHKGLYSYKMDHASLWLANPVYSLYTRRMRGSEHDLTSVTVLKKTAQAWPVR